MTEWRWVSPDVIYAVHDRQISEHGGLSGVRDQGAIESALARPCNLAVHGEPDAAALAASYAYAYAYAYAFGLARNHGFADGNKRTAWIAARLFLADNGFRLSFHKAEAVKIMEALAAGEISEEALTAWFSERMAG